MLYEKSDLGFIHFVFLCRYFTWDPEKFKHPERILGILAAMKRKLVVIIDPHIKVDNSYFVYRAGVEKGLFVKNRNGSNFVGKYYKLRCSTVVSWSFYLTFKLLSKGSLVILSLF